MNTNDITQLKARFQKVIDLIAQKEVAEAQSKLADVTETVNDIIDFATSDKELQEISPYQVLINHLQLKIDVLKSSLN